MSTTSGELEAWEAPGEWRGTLLVHHGVHGQGGAPVAEAGKRNRCTTRGDAAEGGMEKVGAHAAGLQAIVHQSALRSVLIGQKLLLDPD